MNTALHIGIPFAGAVVGFFAGAWYGDATDKSDFPIAMVFTAPAGAVLGGAAGVVAAALFV